MDILQVLVPLSLRILPQYRWWTQKLIKDNELAYFIQRCVGKVKRWTADGKANGN